VSDDVTLPADVAKTLAVYHRDRSKLSLNVVSRDAAQWHREVADLLDPQPPTLREQVLGVIRAAWYSDDSTPEGTADAVLAVVADWLAAQPLMSPEETMRLGLSRPLTRDDQRNHDVRLIRGGGA